MDAYKLIGHAFVHQHYPHVFSNKSDVCDLILLPPDWHRIIMHTQRNRTQLSA